MEASLVTEQSGLPERIGAAETTDLDSDDSSATTSMIPEQGIPVTAAVRIVPRPKTLLVGERSVAREPNLDIDAAERRDAAGFSFRSWLPEENAAHIVRKGGRYKHLGVAAEVPFKKRHVEKDGGVQQPSPLVSGKRKLSNLAKPPEKHHAQYR